MLKSGGASLERVVPTRLSSEPSVFGGATGAEVLIEIVRRAIPPSDALSWIGGAEAQLTSGDAEALLAECALSSSELELVHGAPGASVGELVERAGVPEFTNVLFTLVELGILRSHRAAPGANRRGKHPPAPDVIDHDAVRARIRARRALVEEGDYFALLGVSRNATNYDIRRAFTSLRKEFDPAHILTPFTADLAEDVQLILEILDEAYEILRDAVRRERYRRALEDSPE
jgi:xanthine/CO dehydrogenase XdhC/CoxF family maturation factor